MDPVLLNSPLNPLILLLEGETHSTLYNKHNGDYIFAIEKVSQKTPAESQLSFPRLQSKIRSLFCGNFSTKLQIIESFIFCLCRAA